MDWNRDLAEWPLSELSRRVRSGPHFWHVQDGGTGPVILLLHGAGASTHSWRGIIPILSGSHRVIALDLPGQGFTRLGGQNRCGLEQMTDDITRLCADCDIHPEIIIGHSAGGAIALSLAKTLPKTPEVIGINAALGRFDGVASWLFPLLAKVLVMTPLTARLFSAGSHPDQRARRLIESTGSHLDDIGIGFYARLISDRDHVDATLKMMAQWSVDRLVDTLPRLDAPCLLITGEKDKAVSPRISSEAVEKLPKGSHVTLAGVGHLAHEEDPEMVGQTILRWLAAS